MRSRSSLAPFGGILSAAVLVGLLASSPASAASVSAKPRTGTFNNMSAFPSTDGRVGYHMSVHIGWFDWDTPTGSVASCAPTSNDSVSVTGGLPPGLALVTNAEYTAIEGTPRQAGDWSAYVVTATIGCTQGPDTTNYGPKTLKINFHITP